MNYSVGEESDVEAYLWHSIDQKQDAGHIIRSYQTNFAKRAKMMMLQIIDCAEKQGIELPMDLASKVTNLREAKDPSQVRFLVHYMWGSDLLKKAFTHFKAQSQYPLYL